MFLRDICLYPQAIFIMTSRKKLLHNLKLILNTEISFVDSPLKLPSSKGTYILLMEAYDEKLITVGKIGEISIMPGIYLYVGSAFGAGGLKSRVGRHFKCEKKLKWHIDYLRKELELFGVVFSTLPEKFECGWANVLFERNAFISEPEFGSSDCKCLSHLFFFK